MEEWKKIQDYEHYTISNTGKIRTTAKCKDCEMGTRLWGEYMAVKLSKEGKAHMQTVHRLLAIHFIPNPTNEKYVDHINRDKLDNRLENLRWVSYSENRYNIGTPKHSTTGYKYITKRGNSFHIQLKWSTVYKDCKTIEEAVAWRNAYLEKNNMMCRL